MAEENNPILKTIKFSDNSPTYEIYDEVARNNIANLATVATTGEYGDLINAPTIPIVDPSLDSTSTNAIENRAVYNALQDKQDTLVGTQTAGQNIKTINGNSVLGSGNLAIGSSEMPVFNTQETYPTTTWDGVIMERVEHINIQGIAFHSVPSGLLIDTESSWTIPYNNELTITATANQVNVTLGNTSVNLWDDVNSQWVNLSDPITDDASSLKIIFNSSLARLEFKDKWTDEYISISCEEITSSSFKNMSESVFLILYFEKNYLLFPTTTASNTDFDNDGIYGLTSLEPGTGSVYIPAEPTTLLKDGATPWTITANDNSFSISADTTGITVTVGEQSLDLFSQEWIDERLGFNSEEGGFYIRCRRQPDVDQLGNPTMFLELKLFNYNVSTGENTPISKTVSNSISQADNNVSDYLVFGTGTSIGYDAVGSLPQQKVLVNPLYFTWSNCKAIQFDGVFENNFNGSFSLGYDWGTGYKIVLKDSEDIENPNTLTLYKYVYNTETQSITVESTAVLYESGSWTSLTTVCDCTWDVSTHKLTAPLGLSFSLGSGQIFPLSNVTENITFYGIPVSVVVLDPASSYPNQMAEINDTSMGKRTLIFSTGTEWKFASDVITLTPEQIESAVTNQGKVYTIDIVGKCVINSESLKVGSLHTDGYGNYWWNFAS